MWIYQVHNYFAILFGKEQEIGTNNLVLFSFNISDSQ
ncbi:hypothetical protein SEEN443_09599 [Salmonella enterica subsp. enterica serovar Newport str. CVM 19443]|uniref:Uncharacterized protein n=1 Tax=Salmonella paratyphi B (strain ATCC BAA-1250 / SPB7) TaxID=1016998 RepID=A0A6C6Z648_SALPB|nr:hypothetical protein SPAB_03323 [Salmonella enterica subsp. enterica serovar Paratyphi B str. SPB7]EJA67931.1 hypothetical protein SEEN443_09599 [Salmonella enterica subsp. enterica serovar Newport str. CVM 19443]ESB76137.1 hypothetical protein SEEP3036_01075 [Salmonella enterica subsp. enterica serovar Pullorum str. 13036]ESG81827.1 hypothetical protein SEEJ0721_14555 [Salmonella enterica subsp. enterica serovar Javiana str. 10721]